MSSRGHKRDVCGVAGSREQGSGGAGKQAREAEAARVLQKWQCVEDASGKLKLHKCKGPARPGGRAVSNLVPKYYVQGSEGCVCEGGDGQLTLAGRRKKLFKKSKWDGRGGVGTEQRPLVHSNKPTCPAPSIHPARGGVGRENKEGDERVQG